MEDREKKSLMEALLFLSGEPISASALKGVAGMEESDIKAAMDSLIAEYREKDGGLLLAEVAGGYQFVTNSRFSPWIKKFKGTQASSRLSASALEALAIIAYKQPIIKAEIEQIRGVNSDGVVKSLLDRRLVRIMGRKEAPGKPLLYGTSKEFLQHFGLKDLTELPTLRDLGREEAL